MSELFTTVHSHVPYGKEGSGHYSKHTQAVSATAEEVTELALHALKNLTDVKKKKIYTICDYGCADGGNSINSIRKCIGQLKAKDPNVEVQVWYEDQPTNDFKSLFYRLHGFLHDLPTYMKDYQGVYTAAIGTPFYQQCVPSNSVDLALSTTAVHWLSKRPCNLQDCLWHGLSNDKVEIEKFKDQAAKDWETFLTHRAAEFTVGAQAVIAVPAVDLHGFHSGYTDQAQMSVFLLMSNIWRIMKEEGIITKDEYINTNINVYDRTSKEIEAPFKDKKSPVYKLGLRLSSMEIRTIPCTLHAEYLNKGKGNAQLEQTYADKFVNAIRVWSNHSMISGLNERRGEEERRKIVDEFYERIKETVARSPNNHAFGIVNAYLHVSKLLNI